ncbi:hypothetical protein A9K55_007513 [Cordyceps militaris]|uniref:Uncharacterized protein n=1 Tax=Cordyceps militaris TaxID=73501 RepID=A0A2H4SI11_CORMI|nr:hypothetical protein A9K55_007513 [Cordyceps militaris]
MAPVCRRRCWSWHGFSLLLLAAPRRCSAPLLAAAPHAPPAQSPVPSTPLVVSALTNTSPARQHGYALVLHQWMEACSSLLNLMQDQRRVALPVPPPPGHLKSLPLPPPSSLSHTPLVVDHSPRPEGIATSTSCTTTQVRLSCRDVNHHLGIPAAIMLEATYMDQLQSTSGLSDPMDISDASTTIASPPSSDFPELMPFTASSSYHMSADCSLPFSPPASSIASPPMPHVAKQYALYTESSLAHLPSPPTSAKMFYPQHWNANFGLDHGPGPNEDVAIPQEFYMQERCTPDPDSYLSSYPLADSQSPSLLNQSVPYFAPVPHLGSNGPPMMHSSTMNSEDSPKTLETFSEVSTPGEESKSEAAPSKRASRKRSTCTTLEASKEDGDSDQDSHYEADSSPRRDSSGRKPRKRAAPKRSSASRIASVDVGEYQNCFGDMIAPRLKENCPKEERCIFLSRWQHRDKKGQDMWDSIQEDYFREFDKEQCKETLQMKLTRGRSKYIEWYVKDEEILLQAWQNMERNRYKTLLDEFHRLGGSRNMLLNPSDIEVKVVADMRLEDEVYSGHMHEMELRRRFRLWWGKKKTGGRNTEELNTSYSGPSLFGRPVDVDEVLDQVVEHQLDGAERRGSGQRRKRSSAKPSRVLKKIKLEKD